MALAGRRLRSAPGRNFAVTRPPLWYRTLTWISCGHILPYIVTSDQLSTVWCRYNAVKFPQYPHKKTSRSSPVRARYGLSAVTLTFCHCYRSARCNIVINWAALLRHLTVCICPGPHKEVMNLSGNDIAYAANSSNGYGKYLPSGYWTPKTAHSLPRGAKQVV